MAASGTEDEYRKIKDIYSILSEIIDRKSEGIETPNALYEYEPSLRQPSETYEEHKKRELQKKIVMNFIDIIYNNEHTIVNDDFKKFIKEQFINSIEPDIDSNPVLRPMHSLYVKKLLSIIDRESNTEYGAGRVRQYYEPLKEYIKEYHYRELLLSLNKFFISKENHSIGTDREIYGYIKQYISNEIDAVYRNIYNIFNSYFQAGMSRDDFISTFDSLKEYVLTSHDYVDEISVKLRWLYGIIQKKLFDGYGLS